MAFHALGEEHLRAVASPAVASGSNCRWLNRTAHLAYDLDRPLLRTWQANQIELTSQPALTAPDLKYCDRDCAGSADGMPGYLTRSERLPTLIEIPAPITVPRNAYYLVWARSSLRHPRVAMARNALIAALRT